jgi:hypothetical protein
MVFLAWVAEGSSQVMSATLPVSGGSWSTPLATPAVTSVAPALGVYVDPSTLGALKAGLYLAWNTGSGLDYADWDDGWSAAVPIPGLPIPPGPLTPALVSTAITMPGCTLTYYDFSVVYDYTAASTYQGIDYLTLSTDVAGKCVPPCRGLTCT